MHFSYAATTALLVTASLGTFSVAATDINPSSDDLAHRAAHRSWQHIRKRRHAQQQERNEGKEETHSLEKRGFNGQATYFAVGLGACGSTARASEAVVALNSAQYGSGKYCGKEIRITANGKSVNAVIQDECPSCAWGSLDLSKSLFLTFFPVSKGQFDMTWTFTDSSLNPAPPKPKMKTRPKPTPKPSPPKPSPKPKPKPSSTKAKPSASSSSSTSASSSTSSSAKSAAAKKPAKTTASAANIADLNDIIGGFRSVVKIGQKLPPPTTTKPLPPSTSVNGTSSTAAMTVSSSAISSAPINTASIAQSAPTSSKSSMVESISSASEPASASASNVTLSTAAPSPAEATPALATSAPYNPFSALVKMP